MLSVMSVSAVAARTIFSVKPVVLFGGNDEYNIVWENNVNTVGFVSYTYNGYNYTVYDEENGVVRSDDKMHTVRIPQEHLDKAGSYMVVASEVVSRDGYDIKLGAPIAFESEFYGYRGQEEITIGFISDSHLNVYNATNRNKMLESITRVTEEYMDAPDIVVMQGDITNELIAKQEFYDLFEMFRVASLGGKRPIIYAVGNHEKRGFYSKEIEKYLVYDTGEFYGQINYGPISTYVADIGEDKEDESISYSGPDGGVVDMERYYPEQLYYFQNHPGYKEGARYTFTLGHGHTYVGYNGYPANAHKFAETFQQKGTDFHICGHTHKLRFSESTEYLPYPLIEDGWFAGNQTEQRSVLITIKDGVYNIKAMDQYGKTAWTQQIEADANGSPTPTTQKIPHIADEGVEKPQSVIDDSNIPTMAGVSTSVIKGASNTTALVTKPVVFDAGEYYSVVWQTTVGIKSAGYVDIEGIEKTYMDAHGGKLRTETTHSVRIPKSVLSGKTYTISSRIVTNYNGYGTHSKTDPLTFGPYSKGTAVEFIDTANTNSDYTIVAVANKTGGVTDANKLLSKYSQLPNLLVLMGDMTTDLNSEENFASILNYANTFTGGKCPVLLLRGENETKGEFAPYLSRIIRPVTPELVLNRTYHNFKQGDLSVIGLDTATKNMDSYLGYYGYANFDKIRAEQNEWLKNSNSFAEKYNIVFANETELRYCVGVNFTQNFKKHNVHLTVGAGKTTEFTNGNTMYSTAAVGDANALIINCSDNQITVSSVTDTVNKLGTINTADVTYVAPEKTYTVTYTDGVDGEVVFADQKTTGLAEGAATPEFDGFPVRKGYTFDGWTPVISAFVNADVTYKAKWTQNPPETYSVTYTDGVGGEEIFADQTTVNISEGTATPQFVGTPSRDGYVFDGWNPAVSDVVTSSVTYTAKWITPQEIKYSVTYTDGVASEEIFVDQVTDNLEKGAKTPEFNGKPTRDGYDFVGWNPAVSDTVISSVTYSAIWKTKPQIQDSSLQFKDIKNKWYKSAVDYMTTFGYMSGMDTKNFGPDVTLSRGMFVTILSRVAGVNVSNKVQTRFSDVKSGKYYTGAVKWAADNGIVAGITTTEFKPDDNITREQLCSIITRFADKFNMPLNETEKQLTFTDANSISSYAKTAVKRCQMAGIVTGIKDGSGYAFNPKGNATRAECAQILYKFLTQA